MAKFKIGDQVTLACSEIKMQVEFTNEKPDGSSTCQCVWIDNGGKPQESWYDDRNLDFVDFDL